MQGSHSNKDYLDYLLALKMIQGIGNVTAFKLLDHYSNAEQIFTASTDQLKRLGLQAQVIKQIHQFDFTQVAAIKNWAISPNRYIIPLGSPHYPKLLSQIYNPPLVLFVLGNLGILQSPQVAVIGSRSPTVQGIQNTHMLCEALVEQGLTITSGLAMGIDGEAHKAALKSQGYTIAVTGTGLNRVYPASHRELAREISEKGVLISEKLPDEPIYKGSFPQRNRIIAGLSMGTLVIEAANKSGSLITAHHAAEEGREVYAIPGSIHNRLTKGCHQLIKQGAKLVESINDIIDDLPYSIHSREPCLSNTHKTELSDEDSQFLQYLDYETTPLDRIVERSQLTVELTTNKLLQLELDGWIINSAGGYSRK